MIVLEKTRVCRRCGNEFPLTIEYFYRNGENNFQYCCKSCMAIKKKEWAVNNRDKVNAYAAKKRAAKTPEQKAKTQEYMRNYHEAHKEEHNAKSKENYYKNREKAKEYRKENRDSINQKKREYEKKKRETDEVYFIKQKIRSVIYKSFSRKGLQKISLAEEITGMSGSDLCSYLLKTYKNNYGYEWDGIEAVHIDHIVPLATANTEDEVKRLCHYSNLQLLKAFDNLSKHDKINFSLGG